MKAFLTKTNFQTTIQPSTKPLDPLTYKQYQVPQYPSTMAQHTVKKVRLPNGGVATIETWERHSVMNLQGRAASEFANHFASRIADGFMMGNQNIRSRVIDLIEDMSPRSGRQMPMLIEDLPRAKKANSSKASKTPKAAKAPKTPKTSKKAPKRKSDVLYLE